MAVTEPGVEILETIKLHSQKSDPVSLSLLAQSRSMVGQRMVPGTRSAVLNSNILQVGAWMIDSSGDRGESLLEPRLASNSLCS